MFEAQVALSGPQVADSERHLKQNNRQPLMPSPRHTCLKHSDITCSVVHSQNLILVQKQFYKISKFTNINNTNILYTTIYMNFTQHKVQNKQHV
jgi:hypothetical protein